jgi:hypothetical protein
MKTRIIFILLTCLILSGCMWFLDHDYIIKIQNNSSDTIKFYSSYTFPDTSLSIEYPRLIMAYPNSYSHLSSEDKWEKVLPHDTIIIFIFNKDTLDNNSWNKVIQKHYILKKYVISLDDLDSLGYTVKYP